jgi:ethanolamine ammonia-lyase large subunit
MGYTATVHGERFAFADLTELLAKANERKSGDELAGIAAATERMRVAAKLALADVRVSDFAAYPLLEDEVTAATRGGLAADAERAMASLTVGQLRELILTPQFPGLWQRTLNGGFLPEVAAAVAKIMSDLDLVLAARPLRTVTRCRNTMGEAGTLGARLQPNHPTDDLAGILAAIVDGLGYACGDAVIGVNPATDSVARTARLLHGINDFTAALGIPTQTCILAHATTQIGALRAGAPVDLLFQSLAGTEDANRSFGVSLSMLREARDEVLASHRERPADFVGEQCVYIETGQGSALSSYSHHGIDQLTLEARAQGAARTLDPFLVNTVVGFIGPEYLADSRQITRAGLEDHFVGKLLGLPMGVDVCYTNHVDADQNTNDDLLMLLTSAGCNYFMGLPAGVDVMLGYQSTSYHDVASMRRLSGMGPAPEFARWAAEAGILANNEISPAASWAGPGTTRGDDAPLDAAPASTASTASTASMLSLAEAIAERREVQSLGPAR